MNRILLILLLLPVLAKAQIITTFAGGGTSGVGDGGPATAATISNPNGGTFDQFGNYYCASNSGSRVRKISNTGIITTIAGTGSSGFSGDNGSATTAQLNGPTAVKLDTNGNIYISDAQNMRIRKIDAITGIITTIAGSTLTPGFGGDNGPATAAMLFAPTDLCFDKLGNIYFTDEQNYRVRKIAPSGIITTFAGTGLPGNTGDNGPATTARISLEGGMTIDDTGNLYIAGGNIVRKIDSSGIITTVAGVYGTYIYTGDNVPATAAPMDPIKLAIDKNGQLTIADDRNYRIYEIDVSGIIHSVAGTGVSGFSGDNGPATAATFSYPAGVTFDACGNLYISEANNNRIRKITYPPILTIPSITLSGVPAAYVGALVTVTATVTNAGSSYNIEWYNHGVQFSTTTVPSVTYTKAGGIDTITARVVSTATYGCYDSTTSEGHTVMVAEEVPFGGLTIAAMEIYPNPVSDVLHIDGVANSSLSLGEGRGEAYTYSILSIVGAVIQQGSLQAGSNSIPIQLLPKGMYILEVTSGEIKTVTKVVKQ